MCIGQFLSSCLHSSLTLNWLVGMELWACESRLDNCTPIMWEASVKY
jgi:hypothetical protein